MEVKTINRKNILQSVVSRFGAVSAARYYVSDALSDLQVMELGAADNNPLKLAECVGSLRESLENLRALLDDKDNKPIIESEIKKHLK